MGGRAPGHTTRPGRSWLTPQEVAGELRVSKMTVYRLIHTGALQALRVRHSFRISERHLDDYLRDADSGFDYEIGDGGVAR
jgi:excisionase family DNA binding protein